MRRKIVHYTIYDKQKKENHGLYATPVEAWKELEFRFLYPEVDNWRIEQARSKTSIKNLAESLGYTVRKVLLSD